MVGLRGYTPFVKKGAEHKLDTMRIIVYCIQYTIMKFISVNLGTY
jgi:hypothetical protein